MLPGSGPRTQHVRPPSLGIPTRSPQVKTEEPANPADGPERGGPPNGDRLVPAPAGIPRFARYALGRSWTTGTRSHWATTPEGFL